MNLEDNITCGETELVIGVCGTITEHLIYSLHGIIFTLAYASPNTINATKSVFSTDHV